MAQRYGGKHSPIPRQPDGSPAPQGQFQGKRRSRAGGRVNMLFAVPFVFVMRAFTGDPAALALNLGAFALLIAAAFLTREGSSPRKPMMPAGSPSARPFRASCSVRS